MKEKMKKYLRENSYTKKPYLKLVSWKNSRQTQNKRMAMQKNGFYVIERIAKIFNDEKIQYFFDFGTLLGIIRENRILPHDTDIDIGVLYKEGTYDKVREALFKSGFKLLYEYMIDDNVVEESYIGFSIKVDINYYFSDGSKSRCYLFYREPGKEYSGDLLDTVEITCDKIETFKEHCFSDILVKVPENPEHLLAQRYGPNWRVPDKNWVYWKGPSAKQLDRQGIRVTHQ